MPSSSFFPRPLTILILYLHVKSAPKFGPLVCFHVTPPTPPRSAPDLRDISKLWDDAPRYCEVFLPYSLFWGGGGVGGVGVGTVDSLEVASM